MAAKPATNSNEWVMAPGPAARWRALHCGEVGATCRPSIKAVADARVGDTIKPAGEFRPPKRCPAMRGPKPMVFCGLFPTDADQYPICAKHSTSLPASPNARLKFEPAETKAAPWLRLPLRLPVGCLHMGNRAGAGWSGNLQNLDLIV